MLSVPKMTADTCHFLYGREPYWLRDMKVKYFLFISVRAIYIFFNTEYN